MDNRWAGEVNLSVSVDHLKISNAGGRVSVERGGVWGERRGGGVSEERGGMSGGWSE